MASWRFPGLIYGCSTNPGWKEVVVAGGIIDSK